MMLSTSLVLAAQNTLSFPFTYVNEGWRFVLSWGSCTEKVSFVEEKIYSHDTGFTAVKVYSFHGDHLVLLVLITVIAGIIHL